MVQVFYYWERMDCVSGITRFHEEECDVGALAEAHPNTIYFYATLQPV